MNPVGVQPLNESFFQKLFQKLFQKNIYINGFGFLGFFLFLIGLILHLINFNKNYNNNNDQKIKDRNVATIVTSIGGILFLLVLIGIKFL